MTLYVEQRTLEIGELDWLGPWPVIKLRNHHVFVKPYCELCKLP